MGAAEEIRGFIAKVLRSDVRIERIELSDIQNSNFPVATVGTSERSILLAVGSVSLGFGENF